MNEQTTVRIPTIEQTIARIERHADGWTLAHDRGGEYVASITFDGSCVAGRADTPAEAFHLAADKLDAMFERGFGATAAWRRGTA